MGYIIAPVSDPHPTLQYALTCTRSVVTTVVPAWCRGSTARCDLKGSCICRETVAESPLLEHLAQPKPIECDSRQTNQSKQFGNRCRINLLAIPKPFLDNRHNWNNCYIFC